MQIMLLIAVFFGYFSIALALPLENSIKNVFLRGMYTAEVCILSPTDILGVAASDALETQMLLVEVHPPQKQYAVRAN